MTDQEFFQKCDNLERRIKQLEAVVGKIEAESEPKFERVKRGEQYYHVGVDYDVCVYPLSDTDNHYNKMGYDNNNYFHTEERAREVCDKIKLLLKLERLHDIFCPDYKPDWNDSTVYKHLVYFNHSRRKYCWDSFAYSESEYAGAVYFPTEEIAQKVCDVLNKDFE